MRLLHLLNTKLLIVPILFVVGLLLQINETKAQTTKEIKFEKYQFYSSQEQTPISVTLKINTQQSVSNEGLKFTIVLHNYGSKSFTFYNPLDVLKLSLVDKDGGNVIIPNDPAYMAKYTGPFFARIESFDIGRTLVNGKKEAIDYKKTEHITIPVNGTYEIDLAIKTVLKDGAKATLTIGDGIVNMPKDNPNAPKAPLTRGEYKLYMLISIFSRGGGNPHFNQILAIPETALSYGL